MCAEDGGRMAEKTSVTSCPFCVTNLGQGAQAIKSKIKVVDVSDILLQVTEPLEEKPAE